MTRQSPQAIRRKKFSRERKGWDTDEVREYLNGLADQLETADAERAWLRAEIDRLQAEGERARGSRPAGRELGDDPDAQTVALFSQAQEVADRLIEDSVQQARDLMTTARRQQRDLVQQAHRLADPARAIPSQRSPASNGSEAPVPEIEDVRSLAQVAQVQLRSILDALTELGDRLGDLPQLKRSQGQSESDPPAKPAVEDSARSSGRQLDVGRPGDPRSWFNP